MPTKYSGEPYLISEVAGINFANEYTEGFVESGIAQGLATALQHICNLADSNMDGIKLRVMDIYAEKYIVTAGGKQYVLRRLR